MVGPARPHQGRDPRGGRCGWPTAPTSTSWTSGLGRPAPAGLQGAPSVRGRRRAAPHRHQQAGQAASCWTSSDLLPNGEGRLAEPSRLDSTPGCASAPRQAFAGLEPVWHEPVIVRGGAGWLEGGAAAGQPGRLVVGVQVDDDPTVLGHRHPVVHQAAAVADTVAPAARVVEVAGPSRSTSACTGGPRRPGGRRRPASPCSVVDRRGAAGRCRAARRTDRAAGSGRTGDVARPGPWPSRRRSRRRPAAARVWLCDGDRRDGEHEQGDGQAEGQQHATQRQRVGARAALAAGCDRAQAVVSRACCAPIESSSPNRGSTATIAGSR